MATKPQGLQFSPELQQQINILNARIGNANLAHSDLLNTVNTTFNMLAKTISELQKENTELKDKHNKTTKTT